jgi:hypothetical protein
MLGTLFATAQPALGIKDIQMAPTLPPVGPGRVETTVATVQAAPQGALAALLRLLGLGRTTTLQVTTHRLARVDQGPSVRDTSILPLSRVSTMHHGFRKNVALLVLGAPLALFGLVLLVSAGAPGIVPLAAGAGLIAAYLTSGLTFSMVFSSVGGIPLVMKLKTKDPGELARLCELVQQLLKQSDNPSPPAHTAPPQPIPPFPPARA